MKQANDTTWKKTQQNDWIWGTSANKTLSLFVFFFLDHFWSDRYDAPAHTQVSNTTDYIMFSLIVGVITLNGNIFGMRV